MKYFTIKELCSTRYKVDNTPTEQIKQNIQWFIENFLDILRDDWGASILVSSGWRGEELNRIVGGSATSSHKTGFAADIRCGKGQDFTQFRNFVYEWCKHHNFDQCIYEHIGDKEWIHISLKKSGNRKQFLKTTDGKHYSIWNQ